MSDKMVEDKNYKRTATHLNKSLFTKFINKTLQRQDIVSSLEEMPFKPLNRGNYFTKNKVDKKAKEHEAEYQEIKITLKEINIELTKRIRILKELDYAAIESWLAEFRNIAKQARWTDEEKVIMLQMTVSPSISADLNISDGFQACADSIFQHVYTPEKAKSLSLYLKGIHQNAYYLIDNYIKDIKCTVNALALSKNGVKVK